jgi:large subunit ribosomal protein L31/Ran GTPase-activating protein 1
MLPNGAPINPILFLLLIMKGNCLLYVQCIDNMAMLQVLDLCSNQLMRPGVLAVARALAARQKVNPVGFDLLALDENAISEEGLDQLREVLKVCGAGSTAAWY